MMKISSLVIATSLLLAGGCSKKEEEGTAQRQGSAAPTPPPPPAAQTPKTLTGADLAAAYTQCIERVNAGKLDEFRTSCIDDNFQVHDAGDGTTRKTDDLIAWFKSMKEGMPDFKLTPQLIAVNGRTVLAVELVTGTHTATMKTPMGDVPPTNKKFGMLMFHRLAIDETNKATEEWSFSDPATLMGQLGMAPKDAPPTRAVLDKGFDGAPILVVSTDDAKEKANLELVKKGVDALNAGKIADAIAMMAPDAVLSDMTEAADVKGGKAIEAGTKAWFGAFKDAKLTVDGTWAAGDYVFLTGTFSGTHDKDLGKIKKTGKTVDIDYAEVYKIKDGKVTELWRFTSGLVFAMQLGLMPTPAATPAAGSAAPAAGSTAAPAPAAPAAAPATGSATN